MARWQRNALPARQLVAPVNAKYIFAALALVFLSLGLARLLLQPEAPQAAARTWLWLGGIFCFVSLWLFLRK